MLQAGTVLGGTYRLEKSLGQGGMGEVWLARHVLLDEPRAIKVMLSNFQSDPVVRERFIRGEARHALRLERHPNIVRVYELGLSEDAPYIVMEYIESGPLGISLRDLMMKRGRLNQMEAGRVLDQLAAGLQVAHQQGFIHRDIKPSNILLDRQGQIKLTDFGLIKAMESNEELTDIGYVVGTPIYRAPEQALGRAEPRSDLYSVGVILYQMLTSQLPFTGNPTELLLKHANSEPPAPRQLAPWLSEEIEKVLLRSLAKKPDDRYFSMREMAEAYRQALGLVPVTANPRPTAPAATSIVDKSGTEEVLVATVPSRGKDKPSSPSVPPHNLPTQATDFVGRTSEIEQICQLLKRPEVRLLTLHGPGGTGKTRLSLQAGRQLLNDFEGGVFFVQLSLIDDPAQVATSIAQTLGLVEAQERPIPAIKDFLHSRQILLILDNFEQITQAAPLIAELLAEASRLKLMVSSREVLRLYGEHTFAVPPLELPNLKKLPPLEKLAELEAIRLFVQCAQAANPHFELTTENAGAVAEICVRLDGLPLALELAAARSRLLPPAAMVSRLSNSLKTLTGGARNLPARQQTLRGAIDWSYELLGDAERSLFSRMAVFVGGCTLEAAEAVMPDEPLLGAADILDGLASLVDKSLLRQLSVGDEPRFSMLGTLQEYALEKLEASGQKEALRQRHLNYYRGLCEEALPGLQTKGREKWLARLTDELDNIRVALDWLRETTDDPETALLEGGDMYDTVNLWFKLQSAKA